MFILVYIVFFILSIILLFILLKVIQLNIERKRVQEDIGRMKYDSFSSVGAVDSLSILPLVDFYSAREGLKTEAGVSYLIKSDNTTILMDLGFNSKKEHPSPLLYNMGVLGIDLDDIDMIFISHVHLDHIGGMRDQRNNTFSISQGPVRIGNIPVYAPKEISPSMWNPEPYVEVVKEPKVLKPGITSIGVIPRAIFLAGRTEEHSLAINVKGKGVVLIIGCGHQSIERIIERTKMLYNEKIYGIIGGLHYPLRGGRIMVGPINLQYMAGNDKPPWRGLSESDVFASIDIIKRENPSHVSLSPHDSSDWTLEQFRGSFKDKYVDLLVGKEIKI